MIFLTVGSEPFDRLVRAFDRWIADSQISEEVFAQIADAKYQPTNCKHVQFLTPNEFLSVFERSRLIVSHAGMGNIITALEFKKPIVVMPRRATLGETRNEHQVATAHHFQKLRQMVVADSELELAAVLNTTLVCLSENRGDEMARFTEGLSPVDPALIRFVRDFVS